MKIVSTNIAKPVQIRWKGTMRQTGIYKKSEAKGIYVRPQGVRGDTIGNPRVHGDRFKACYLFDTGEYDYWKALYPSLDWGYGMFGENLSVAGLDETSLLIGSTYRAGESLLRITAPREPCFKLGVRFGDQGIIDRFVARGKPGTYVEVLEEGWVRPGDLVRLEQQADTALSIADFYRLLYDTDKNRGHLEAALHLPVLDEGKREQFTRWARA